MAASLNQVQLIGNVGRDPEVRYLPSGDAVANFSLATTEKWKDKKGGDKEQTEWHRVEVFGKLAETVNTLVTKGSRVFVQGSMHYDEWTDKDGNKRNGAKVKLGFNGKLVILSFPESAKQKVRKALDESDEAAAPADSDDVPF